MALVIFERAELASAPKRLLLGLSSGQPIDLTEDVRAENLHLTCLGCHAHVGTPVAAIWIATAAVDSASASDVHLVRVHHTVVRLRVSAKHLILLVF